MSDDELAGRFGRIEELLESIVRREQVKEWYTTDEFARIVGKAEFTIREYCRMGRLKAQKRRSGRGSYLSWAIAHAELLRFRKEGLLPWLPVQN